MFDDCVGFEIDHLDVRVLCQVYGVMIGIGERQVIERREFGECLLRGIGDGIDQGKVVIGERYGDELVVVWCLGCVGDVGYYGAEYVVGIGVCDDGW